MTRFGLTSVLVSVALAAFVGPRQTALHLRYRIAQIDAEIERLAQEHGRLVLAREQLTSPRLLAGQLEELGLEMPRLEQTSFLTADGRLVAVADTPPTPHRTQEAH
jgi:hypothetical protein